MNFIEFLRGCGMLLIGSFTIAVCIVILKTPFTKNKSDREEK